MWVDKVGDLCHVPALDVTICLTVSCIHLLCFTIEREASKTLCGVQVYSSSVVCRVTAALWCAVYSSSHTTRRVLSRGQALYVSSQMRPGQRTTADPEIKHLFYPLYTADW